MGSNKDMMELLAIEEAENHPRAHPGHVWLWIGFFVIGWSILLLMFASFVIFLLIVPIFTGVLSVYVTSLLVWQWPPLIPAAMFWFIGLLLLLMAVRVLAIVIRYGWLGMKIYSIYFAVVTVVGLIGSFTGLFGFLDSWSESVSRGLLQDLADSAEDIPVWGIGYIGFEPRSIVEATIFWFQDLDQELMGVFLFTVCAMSLSEVGLLGSAMVKRGQTLQREREEDQNKAQVQNQPRVSEPAPASTDVHGAVYQEPVGARPTPAPTTRPQDYNPVVQPNPTAVGRANRRPAPRAEPDHVLIAQEHLKNGSYDLAIADSTMALQRDPSNLSAYTTRAKAYVDSRQYQLAIADCQQALSINPRDGYAQELLGFARRYI